MRIKSIEIQKGVSSTNLDQKFFEYFIGRIRNVKYVTAGTRTADLFKLYPLI